MSDYFRTQYEKCYEGEEYYWGLEPATYSSTLVIGKYLPLMKQFLRIIVVALSIIIVWIL